MRHRRRGRTLGRSPSHQRALLRNLASSLILSERDDDVNEAGYAYEDIGVKPNKPKVKGRIITTLAKAKEVRPLVERVITIARKALPHERAAEEFQARAPRQSAAWRQWREGESWQKWNRAKAPAIAARRRALQLLGNKQAVEILFDELAERFEDRPGGYTRIVRLAHPRLGDNGTRALLEFVGERDRIRQKSERPTIDDMDEDERASPSGATDDNAGKSAEPEDETAEPEDEAASPEPADEDRPV